MRKIFGILLAAVGAITGVIAFFLLAFLVVTGIGYIGKNMGNEASGYYSFFFVIFLIMATISAIGIIGARKLLRKDI